MRRLLISLCAAVGLFFAAAPAATAQSMGTEDVYYNLNVPTVVSLLDELGLSYEPSAFFANWMQVTSSDGFVFHVGLTACSNPGKSEGCLALHMIGSWSFAPNQFERVQDITTGFDNQYAFASSYIGYIEAEGTDRAIVSRYAITDGGVTRTYLIENLRNYMAVLPLFHEALAGTG